LHHDPYGKNQIWINDLHFGTFWIHFSSFCINLAHFGLV